MGLLNYTNNLIFPKISQVSVAELMERLNRAMASKRLGDLRRKGDRLIFRNLYLKKLDLLPIPSGWIEVKEVGKDLHVTFSAKYDWKINSRGRILAGIAGFLMLLVTFLKSYEFYNSGGLFPSPVFFLVIPLYVYLLWLFVFALNSFYSRHYMTRLISSMMY